MALQDQRDNQGIEVPRDLLGPRESMEILEVQDKLVCRVYEGPRVDKVPWVKVDLPDQGASQEQMVKTVKPDLKGYKDFQVQLDPMETRDL